MNEEPSRATTHFPVRRALILAAGTLLFASACDTTTPNGPDGNVFAPGKPRYGYGSPEQQAAATQRASAERAAAAVNSTKTLDSKRLREIKRDPNDTTVDVTPPESKIDKKDPAGTDVTGSGTTETTTTETTTTPSDSGSTSGATGSSTTATDTSTTESKPAVTREDLPFGQPVVGKKGYVYSPYAPDKGQVDVDGIPAGTKVKCPYTGKVFRVP